MLELVQNRAGDKGFLRFQGLSILRVNGIGDLPSDDLRLADGVLVQAGSVYEALEILSLIRSDQQRVISLLPVFISNQMPRHSSISFLYDGIWTDGHERNELQYIRSINRKRKALVNEIHELDFERALSLKVSQFMFTREASLQPHRLRHIDTGYAFPFISSVFSDTEGLQAITLLDDMHSKGYLRTDYLDRIQSCSSCSGGYLNYRECCPSCGSSDLEISDLIHHFVCAHVAPEGDFKKEDRLECPKCDKTLRHIGIDYDKPSSMYSCNACQHQFQNATVKALCVDCGHDNDLTLLKSVKINAYSLTSKGEQLAQFGFHNSGPKTKSKENQSNIISTQVYDLFRQQEQLRAEAAGSTVFEGTLTIDIKAIDKFSEDRQAVIRQEVCSIISSYLSPVDLVSSPNSRTYKFLLCGKDGEQVSTLGDLLQNNISRLLTDGIGSNTCIQVLINPLTGPEN